MILSKGTCTGPLADEYNKAIKKLVEMKNPAPNAANTAMHYFTTHIDLYLLAKKQGKMVLWIYHFFYNDPYHLYWDCLMLFVP